LPHAIEIPAAAGLVLASIVIDDQAASGSRTLGCCFSRHETARVRLCPGWLVGSVDLGQGPRIGRTQTGRPF
jgi:hypothetical protein